MKTVKEILEELKKFPPETPAIGIFNGRLSELAIYEIGYDTKEEKWLDEPDPNHLAVVIECFR